jgi:hypothetical protein
MTEARRTPRRGPGTFTVATASLAAFLILLTFLAWQLRAGRDSALGAARPAQQAPGKRILVRRIIRRVVVERVVPAPVAATSSATPLAAQVGTSSPGAASATPSAPAASQVPAAAPAPTRPAPAPAPAPVTRSS